MQLLLLTLVVLPAVVIGEVFGFTDLLKGQLHVL